MLPAARLTQLRDICNHMKYRHQVLSEWGFERKLVSSKGLMALFATHPPIEARIRALQAQG